MASDAGMGAPCRVTLRHLPERCKLRPFTITISQFMLSKRLLLANGLLRGHAVGEGACVVIHPFYRGTAMHRTASAIMSVSLAVGLAACSSSGSSTAPPGPSPQTATVNATPSLAFTPSSVTIAPGGSITFAFGSVGHNVKFDTGTNPPSDITGVNASTSVARTFATAGTYTYHCTIHPNMTGTVVVAASTTTMNNPPSNGGGY
jgi:plastocyanin